MIYVLREDSEIPEESLDPLNVEPTTGVVKNYYDRSGSLQDELAARLPHLGPIYKYNNNSVFLFIEKSSRNTSVESTV